MFPLGSVLFPSMPLALRVFEERYLAMLASVLQEEPSEFGVVLIERGQEVGGGEHRFDVGTVARIAQLESAEGFIALIAHGTRRFRVVEWLPDDPYPRALVTEIDELDWDDSLDGHPRAASSRRCGARSPWAPSSGTCSTPRRWNSRTTRWMPHGSWPRSPR